MYITILANGAFPTVPTVLQRLGAADMVVCCDGALGKYLQWYRRQHPRPLSTISVVGDGDSLSPSLLQEAHHEGLAIDHRLIAEQETNDLSKAVRYAYEKYRPKDSTSVHVDILGATGKREDHTLGNISLLSFYARQYPEFSFAMPSDYGIFFPVEGQRRFRTIPGQQVSIFALATDSPVSVKGLVYPIDNRCFQWLWEGTLNEAAGNSFEVSGERVVVYLKHPGC